MKPRKCIGFLEIKCNVTKPVFQIRFLRFFFSVNLLNFQVYYKNETVDDQDRQCVCSYGLLPYFT